MTARPPADDQPDLPDWATGAWTNDEGGYASLSYGAPTYEPESGSRPAAHHDDQWHHDDWDDGEQYHEEWYEGGSDGDVGDGPLIDMVTRRRFLAGLAVTGTAGYTAYWALNRPEGVEGAAPSTSSSTTAPANAGPTTTQVSLPAAEGVEGEASVGDDTLRAANVDERVLVLIELEGGNDGPSTVVPASAGTYYDLRPNLSISSDSVLAIDDQVGLNPNLARIHARPVAVVEGVGPVDGSMSHFEMVARWERGDVDGRNGQRTGFLARLSDAVNTGGGVVGLSVAGHTPRFTNVGANTLSLEDLNQLRVLTKSDWIFPGYRQAVTSFQGGPLTTTMAESWADLIQLGRALPGNLEEIDRKQPMIAESRELGSQLAMAAELIRADVGVRVVHARLGGFDTHKGHEWKHERLMTELDVAVGGFLDKIEGYGLSERVLVATSSEFGRRARENSSGLDHGAASTMLMVGPVVTGRHGEASSLSNLDSRGNFATTVPFDVYLGTLASWLGVEPGAVLPSDPESIPLFA
ncbi:MAG: DUF1501 domain-containing protein [Actinomycetota bacterium]